MPFRYSTFGERFTRPSGAFELMDDLARAMSGQSSVFMLGGGNPGRIPAMQRVFRERLQEVAADRALFDRMLANYAHPSGEHRFRSSLASLLRREYGWPLTAENIALTAGSQSAFFMLFNLFAGESPEGGKKRILLPLTPEYVGYSNVTLGEDLLTARRSTITHIDDDLFKYGLDFGNLAIDEHVSAVCVSRPTNPTGNVLTDAEMLRLEEACRDASIPLIVDNAYGAPFPNIVFTEATPRWNAGTIFCLSLSKLGLPGVRTGIVVADEPIIQALGNMIAVLNLAVGSVGPVLVQPLIDSGEILEFSQDTIRPFYQEKATRAVALLRRELKGLPFRIHKPEGAFFLWLWLEGLPDGSAALYRRLKQAGVAVLPGDHFFAGLAEPWAHSSECLRLSVARDDETVERGIRLLAREVKTVYSAR